MSKTYYNHHNNEPNHFKLSEFVVCIEYDYIYGIVTDLGSRDSCCVHWINIPDHISLKSAWWDKEDLRKIGTLNEMFLYENAEVFCN